MPHRTGVIPEGEPWACGYCYKTYSSFQKANECEMRCALRHAVKREMGHVAAGEHSRKQGLAISYSKTRRRMTGEERLKEANRQIMEAIKQYTLMFPRRKRRKRR